MSSYAYNGYKAFCQRKLLQTSPKSVPRVFPPCFLEWQSASTFEGMSLPFSYPLGKNQNFETNTKEFLAGESSNFAVDSWTTAAEISKELAQHK